MPKVTAAKLKRWQDEALADVQSGRAPNFALATLTQYPRTILLVASDDPEEVAELKRVTLTLALIFNDLKDATWARETLGLWPPADPNRIEPYVGQHSAMMTFFTRHACGVLSELANVLHAKKAVLVSPVFESARHRLKKQRPLALEAWDGMVAALDRPTKKAPIASAVGRSIGFVRNKAAYHYGHRSDENLSELHRGYAQHFSDDRDERKKLAYASLGESMERSRFYFADAAVQALTIAAFSTEKVTPTEFHEFMHQIGFALRFMVEALMSHLAGPRR